MTKYKVGALREWTFYAHDPYGSGTVIYVECAYKDDVLAFEIEGNDIPQLDSRFPNDVIDFALQLYNKIK